MGSEIMITIKREYMNNSVDKSKIIKIINVVYYSIFVLICIISCVLLLYGTFEHVDRCFKISAYGFSAIFGITSIYLIVNKERGYIIFFITFIILSILTFIIALQL